MKVISFPARERDESAVRCARELLERCERGEVVAFTALLENADESMGVFGSATPSRLRTAGMLLDAAITRLADD